MKSFSQRTKEGLCRPASQKACCELAELSGIILFAGRIHGEKIKLYSECRAVIERFCRLYERRIGKAPDFVTGKNSFCCTVALNARICKLCGIADTAGTHAFSVPDGIIKKDCCRAAFLRGAFLGGGTIVDPNKNYNMEILTSDAEMCEFLDGILKEIGLEFKKSKRNTKYVLYTKNSEVICDTLTSMGAFGAQMEMLNVKIERELRNDLNRVANGETANMDKVITASIRQIKAINTIEETSGLDSLPDDLREIAVLRSRNKDLSLEQLGKKLTPPLSKSGVNHRMKKIIDIAENGC